MRLLVPGPRPVGMIVTELPISRPAVSKHLRILEKAERVPHERQGNRNLFRLNPVGFAVACRWLGAFWDKGLNRFTAVAKALEEKDRP
ncbi:MAG: helix-turn-helix transcriptional regulator [Chlorobi bacterium]|nr:helix-turn-helix transcriptional regulator [Chlorobiota bacterium]